ncbi:FAD-binding domain-containing protein [Tabrizicola sp.]|uniref:FAD-binding domain-containing protein n=1 Tax=Tabrizicola sp. TaxID=2005166 RepID=UPI002FDC9C11
MNVLVWFRRDLRVHDHPALTLAAGIGPVLPVYVVDPELWSQPDTSARQWAFVAESLAGLREDLAGLGAPLVLRVGDALQVLAGLCRRHGISRIVSHEEPGTSWTQARDRRVAAWASDAGISWTELPQPGAGCAACPALPAPALRGIAGAEPGLIPSARALRLAADPCPHRQLGGRARGLELLDSFLTQRGESYRTAQASPLATERASSRLSPHLAHGTLSLREVMQATAARQAARPGRRWGGSLARFQTSLAARERGIAAPNAERADPFTLAHAQPDPFDPARLAAWSNGETGLPFLDACLRYLRATGWLNARLRAMLVSVACGPLSLEEQAVGAHLARMFTDYDPALHWPQVQAGALGSSPRLWNPVRLGRELDPEGAFTRAWLPELAPVPDALLHDPWRWPEARRRLAHRYPEPVVDLQSAEREARARLRQARLSAGFAERPGGLVRRSGTRRHPSGQLSLPL